MTNRAAILVTIEGLGTNLVGCYGAAICPTPNWNRLASHAVVFDQFWADSIDVVEVLTSMISGTHALTRRSSGTVNQDSILNAPALIVTDDEKVASQLSPYAEVVFVDPIQTSEDVTLFERLISLAMESWLTRFESTPVLWIHSRGLAGTWDAPYSLRELMCDEGDPDPPRASVPDSIWVDKQTDPDEVFGWVCGAGGQAISIDGAWALLTDAMEELGIDDSCLVTLAGVNGFPFGEHGRLGFGTVTSRDGASIDHQLYAERLHLPLIMKPGNRLPLGDRNSIILQPCELAFFINRWMNGQELIPSQGPSANMATSNDTRMLSDNLATQARFLSAIAIYKDEEHLVVPSWSCRWNESLELFATPEDRWEQNDISMRASDVCEFMEAIRVAWRSAALGDQECKDKLEQMLLSMDHQLVSSVR